MSSVRELKVIFDEIQPRLDQMAEQFPWEDRDAYLGWLVSTHEYVRSATRILALTGGRLPESKTAMSNRFIAHAAEEKGHEKLLENDVKQMGLNIHTLPRTAIAKAFHYSFFYWIYKGDPLGIFGLILVLEGFAVRNVAKVHKRALAAHGPKVVSFLRVHAEEDPDHLEKAFDSMTNLSVEDCTLVGEAMRFYGEMYLQMVQGILDKKNKVRIAAAA